MLDQNQRDYLAGLVVMDGRKKEKSLARARQHPGQSVEEFELFVDGLRRKLAFQEDVLEILEGEDDA